MVLSASAAWVAEKFSSQCFFAKQALTTFIALDIMRPVHTIPL